MREELAQVVDLVKANPDFALLLQSPAISKKDKTALLERIFKGQVSTLLLNFLMVLCMKDRLGILTDIERCYAKLEDIHAGRITGTFITAVELARNEQIPPFMASAIYR